MTETETRLREFESDLVVESYDVVAEDVVAVTLVHPEGETLPAWTPGAHIDLILTPEITRQYSLCGSPADSDRFAVGILNAPNSRGGSRHVHESVSAGSVIRIRGPRNHFPLVASPRYVFIAGGIGVTPMLPMIAEAEAAGADWTLLYGGRSEESMAFIDQLRAYGDRVTLLPGNDVALMSAALDERIGTPQPDTLVYTCGPEGLLGAVEAALRRLAGRVAAPRALRGQGHGGRGRHRVRGGAGPDGHHHHRARRPLDLRRRAGPRRQRARLLP